MTIFHFYTISIHSKSLPSYSLIKHLSYFDKHLISRKNHPYNSATDTKSTFLRFPYIQIFNFKIILFWFFRYFNFIVKLILHYVLSIFIIPYPLKIRSPILYQNSIRTSSALLNSKNKKITNFTFFNNLHHLKSTKKINYFDKKWTTSDIRV